MVIKAFLWVVAVIVTNLGCWFVGTVVLHQKSGRAAKAGGWLGSLSEGRSRSLRHWAFKIVLLTGLLLGSLVWLTTEPHENAGGIVLASVVAGSMAVLQWPLVRYTHAPMTVAGLFMARPIKGKAGKETVQRPALLDQLRVDGRASGAGFLFGTAYWWFVPFLSVISIWAIDNEVDPVSTTAVRVVLAAMLISPIVLFVAGWSSRAASLASGGIEDVLQVDDDEALDLRWYSRRWALSEWFVQVFGLILAAIVVFIGLAWVSVFLGLVIEQAADFMSVSVEGSSAFLAAVGLAGAGIVAWVSTPSAAKLRRRRAYPANALMYAARRSPCMSITTSQLSAEIVYRSTPPHVELRRNLKSSIYEESSPLADICSDDVVYADDPSGDPGRVLVEVKFKSDQERQTAWFAFAAAVLDEGEVLSIKRYAKPADKPVEDDPVMQGRPAWVEICYPQRCRPCADSCEAAASNVELARSIVGLAFALGGAIGFGTRSILERRSRRTAS